MPRIRKKTSKRGTTNERRKIANKVRESRKKKSKAAKKNTEWKSKHKKDPGIPSTFPYKDQLLAEVAEQRRQAEESKQRRKEEKRAAKSGTLQDEDEGAQESTEADKNLEEVASLAARHLVTAQVTSSKSLHEDEDESDEAEVPLLVNPDLPDLNAVLECADVIVNVLDARDPLPHRSKHIEEWIHEKPGKRLIFVLNKIDTCPREAVSAWAAHLRAQHRTFLFRSASAFLPGDSLPTPKAKGKVAVKQSSDALGVDAIIHCLEQWAKETAGTEQLNVAVIGPTNSGKSSFVNSLLRRAAFPIYALSSSSSTPSTTTQAHEATMDLESIILRIIDTPGLMWKQGESNEVAALRTRDILLRNKGRIDRLKDPIPVVEHILERSAHEDLMILYNLPAFAKGHTTSFLSGLARTKQLVMKHGKLDLIGASRIILRDWNVGKFPRYTMPPAQNHAHKTDATELYAPDTDILNALPTRKEMRREHGVVKMTPCDIDAREVAIEEPWLNVEDSESEDDKSDEDDGMEGEEEEPVIEEPSDDQSEDESEHGGDENTEDSDSSQVDESHLRPALVSTLKRKRAQHSAISHSTKRVAFAAGTKNKVPKPSRSIPLSKPTPKGLPKKIKARSKV